MTEENHEIKYFTDRDTLELYNLFMGRKTALIQEIVFVENTMALIEKRKGMPFSPRKFTADFELDGK